MTITQIPHEQTVADAHATQTKYFAERLQAICHGAAKKAGWWTTKDGTPVIANPYAFSNKLMLVVSECAEAMEGDRKNLKDDKLPHRDMREVELADAVIRIFDLAGAYGMDLGGAVAEKMTFNSIRPDHKPEAREAEGGKTY
jgi:NTP pyrophosphatase (non-canonical NTP hydrolase)